MRIRQDYSHVAVKNLCPGIVLRHHNDFSGEDHGTELSASEGVRSLLSLAFMARWTDLAKVFEAFESPH